MEIATGFVF